MPIKFVKCRRIDDPSQVADIAESALPHLSGWEPVPDEPEKSTVTGSAAEPPTPDGEPEPGAGAQTDAGDASASPATRKSRSRAATEK